MKARDLSISTTIYFINPENGGNGDVAIKRIINDAGRVSIGVDHGDRVLSCRPEDNFVTTDGIDYYFGEPEFLKNVLPHQERRVFKLQNEYGMAKGWLDEIRNRLKKL